jgi:hypothetical protein
VKDLRLNKNKRLRKYGSEMGKLFGEEPLGAEFKKRYPHFFVV